VVPHPAGDSEVSSSDAIHAVLFDSAKPVLIAPRTGPSNQLHRPTSPSTEPKEERSNGREDMAR